MGNGASVDVGDRVMTAQQNMEVDGDASERVQQLQQCVVDLTEENEMVKNYVANRDAEEIKEACSGFGTNDSKLINIVCARTKTQLDRIDQVYREKYERSLREQIEGETSGNYAKMLVYSLMAPEEFGAAMVDRACKGLGTDELLLTETLAFRSNAEIAALKEYWEGANDKSLTDYLASELSGDLEDLLLKLLNGGRGEEEEADADAAAEQAEQLHKAGVGKRFGTDEETFIEVLGAASPAQIEAIKEAYEANHGMSLHEAIQKEFSGDLKECLQLYIQPKTDALCFILKKAMKGLGTDEDAIIRVLGGSDRHYVQTLAARFMEKYDQALDDALRGELGGNFRDAVLSWVSPEGDPTLGLEQQTEAPMPEDEDEEALVAALNERLTLLLKENDNLKTHVAKVDAAKVHEACKGFGTNDAMLIGVLCSRTKKQLDRVDEIYRERHGRTLREEIEAECSGDYKEFLVYTQMLEEEFDAHQFRKACAGLGTDEDLLIELLTTRTNERIAKAKEYYEGMFDESLTDKLAGETSGHFQTLLLRLLNGERDEGEEADADAAAEQADALYEAGEAAFGTDEEKFIEVLAGASRAQIQAINDAYEAKYEKSLAAAIEGEFSGDLEDALVALCSTPVDWFCRNLKEAFKGFGTDEDAVSRILGGHNKQEARAIADRYKEKYDADLDDALRRELGGDYRSAVLTWLAADDPSGGEETRKRGGRRSRQRRRRRRPRRRRSR